MFTKNWYRLIGNMIIKDSGNTYKAVDGSIKNILATSSLISLGTTDAYSGSYYAQIRKLVTSLDESAGVVLGTGTTPVTLDDYCLSGEVISTYNYSEKTTRTFEENSSVLTTIYTITNTGENSFTIGEIGMIAALNYNSNTNRTHKGLIERTVLETPVTIPAGGVGQVTYTIRMNYPVA